MKKLFFAFILLAAAVVNIFAQQAENAEPKQISAGVLNQKATSLPKPEYPPAAKAVRATGTVNVQVVIDEKGKVISAKAASGHPLLQEAAVNAARQAKFEPTLLDGKPIKISGIVVYNFIVPGSSNSAPPLTAPEETNKSDEMVLFTGLSMFLTALKDIEPDEETSGIIREIANSFPSEFPAEKGQLNKLASAKRDEQAKIIDDFNASFARKLSGTELWLFDFGKHWGTALGQAYKLTGDNMRGDKVKFIDSINKMTALINSAPKDVPPVVLEKIRKIALPSDESDLVSQEFIRDFFRASLEFIEFIAPADEKNGTN